MSILNDFNATLFADDAVFYSCDKDFSSVFNKLYYFINHLSQCMQLNKLTPNISKTKLMIFNAKRPNVLPFILFNYEIVEYVDSFKYLCIFIDNKLNFNFT